MQTPNNNQIIQGTVNIIIKLSETILTATDEIMTGMNSNNIEMKSNRRLHQFHQNPQVAFYRQFWIHHRQLRHKMSNALEIELKGTGSKSINQSINQRKMAIKPREKELTTGTENLWIANHFRLETTFCSGNDPFIKFSKSYYASHVGLWSVTLAIYETTK